MVESVSNSDSVNLLSWAEVERHKSVKDRWIVVENRVYDITKWQNSHPGGRKILGHFEGQDATEAFLAFHNDSDKVRRYLKPYYVGDLLVEKEPTEAAKKRAAYAEDFENVRLKMHELGFFKPSMTFFMGMLAHVFLFEALAYYNLVYFGTGWGFRIISIILYTIAEAQESWLQHDFGHQSVFKSTRWNHFFHEVTLGLCKGYSCLWWNNMHNQHHAKPNVIDKDPDMRLEPLFVVGDTLPVRAASGKSGWKRHLPYGYQDKYFFLTLPPFLLAIHFQLASFRYIFLRKRWEDLAWVTAFFAKLFILYVPLLGFWNTVLYFFLVRVCESHWFIWVSQSNHLPMEVSYDRAEAWLPMQNRATCNVEHSLFNDWFTGHLNFQLEHHLFPTMPRNNLIKTTPYVKELLERHNLPYLIKPLGLAFRDIITALKRSAKLWVEACAKEKAN